MKRRSLADFSSWAEIFSAKVNRGELLPWSDGYVLTDAERTRITTSIQQFELGENAEGRSFRAAAARYAERSGDWEYLRALQLFIKEEQRHSSYLRRFMNAQQIPCAEGHWVDDTFRWMRKRAGLELFIVVLVSAELVARPYYRALKAATGSPLLRAICKEILRDEADHLCFQGNALRKLRQGRGRTAAGVVELLQIVLMVGTCVVVWGSHQQVLRSGGYTLRSFTRECISGIIWLNRLASKPLTGARPQPEVEQRRSGHGMKGSGIKAHPARVGG